MSDSVSPWTAAYQAPLSMGFSRQEFWSGVPLPSPVDLGMCLQKYCDSAQLRYVPRRAMAEGSRPT